MGGSDVAGGRMGMCGSSVLWHSVGPRVSRWRTFDSCGSMCGPSGSSGIVAGALFFEIGRCAWHLIFRMCTLVRLETSDTTPDQVVLDDFAIAQSTPLPERIAGIEGDKV